MTKEKPGQPPPAEGLRLDWQVIPAQVRKAVEERLGSPIVSVVSQPKGFSPGIAARLLTADNQRIFVKAAGPEPNPEVASIHRREAQIAALLPPTAPVPRLLWSYDDKDNTGWIVLAFEAIDGQHPTQPWLLPELTRVLDALVAMTNTLTPSPLPLGIVPTASGKFATDLCGWQRLQQTQPAYLDQLDAWSSRHLATLAKIEATASTAVVGNTLLHLDIREDNLLLTSDAVWVVDWPHACVGAAWVDVVCFAPSVTMQGGPPPEHIIAHHPASRQADFDAMTAAIVSLAGYFTHRALQPPPPGLPTLRQFQAAQGAVARNWVAQRLGWN
jgi:aminoglycoside phosphotransferase (APT) family kinase protein